MATNSPRSIVRLRSLKTGGPPKPFETFCSWRNDMAEVSRGSGGFEPPLQQAHQAVEDKADETDSQDRQDDMLVDEAVVFLPEEAADARTAGEHFGGHDHQPRDSKAQAKPGK